MATGNNSERRPYLTSTVLDQDFLDEAQDNLVNQLELVVEIEAPVGSATPDGFIYASDRNKYVGGVFYEALLKFPTIKRTVGEFLSPTLQFETTTLEITNVDGRFNDILPAGGNFAGWAGKSVIVKMGLRDVASTYKPIFQGKITEQSGFSRSTSSISIIARNRFDSINEQFPRDVFTLTEFPNLAEGKENAAIPYVLGDWTVDVEPFMASVPGIAVNDKDPDVNGENDPTRNNVQLVISINANVSFDTSEVYVQRGENVWRMPASEVVTTGAFVSAGATNSRFELIQGGPAMTAITTINSETADESFQFSTSDKIYVKVKGKDLGAYDDNIVEQARDVLINYGGLAVGEFNANWDSLRDKSTPTESAISTFKSRVWQQEPVGALEFSLSLLEQVRIEAFIDRDLKMKLMPVHLDEFVSSPDFVIRNWDLERKTFKPKLDERTNINRLGGVFNYLANRNENFRETSVYRNDAAITLVGKEISKKLVFPNLYEAGTVSDQVQEILKVTSSYLENVYLNCTWRSMLLDIGDFVKLNIDIEGTKFSNVPCLIREIGYDPNGIKIPMRIWSLQMVPFPGHSPGFAGITGGSTATITEE